jgi:hypothetical protein
MQVNNIESGPPMGAKRECLRNARNDREGGTRETQRGAPAVGCSTVTKTSGCLAFSSTMSLIAEQGTPSGMRTASHSAVVLRARGSMGYIIRDRCKTAMCRARERKKSRPYDTPRYDKHDSPRGKLFFYQLLQLAAVAHSRRVACVLRVLDQLPEP